MTTYAQYQAGDYDERGDVGRALRQGISQVARGRLRRSISRRAAITPDPRHFARSGSRAKGAGGVQEGRPGLSEFRICRATPNSRSRSPSDQLAGKEMSIGRFYLNRRNYTAAINRFRNVLTNYQTTRHAEEALYRLTEAYMGLGITDEAQTAAAVLGHNFPDGQWYKDAYALLKSGGLVAAGTPGILDLQALPLRRSVLTRRAGTMLARLSIRDIVLIDQLDLEFARGLTILTGETGAGKSILLDALSLALGARGDGALVRHGQAQGQVTAVFELAAGHPSLQALAGAVRSPGTAN